MRCMGKRRREDEVQRLARRAAGGDLTSARSLVAALEGRRGARSSGDEYVVEIWVRVTDRDALYAEAVQRGEDGGLMGYRPKSTDDALRMIFDPGTSPPGTEILDSTCEEA